MTDQQIIQLVLQTIQKNNNSSRSSSTSSVTPIASSILTYVGLVGSDGTAILLPRGWSIFKDTGAGNGIYYITHNLGNVLSDSSASKISPLYTCVASAAQSTNIYAVPVIEGFDNEVDFSWADIATGTKADTSFFFSLTVVNNRNTTVPKYYGTYVKGTQ